MAYKFEKLEIYQLALEYLDLVYALAAKLPKSEEFNLRSQIVRAATSIVLNIAEGSTSQSDAEQARFIGMALVRTWKQSPVSTLSLAANLLARWN